MVNDYGIHLVDHHAALLADSAISVEVARERGYRTAQSRKELGSRGFSSGQQNVPALLIPVYDELGNVALHQARPDEPRVTKAGKPVKYETPAKVRMVADVPPRVRPRLADPTRPLWITEGVRKADAAVTAGLDCLALLGVWNWRGKREQDAPLALAIWEHIALAGRCVYIAFDSDAMLKRSVHTALVRLGRMLARRGAEVAYTYLPSGDGDKVGLDDYLAAGGTIPDLVASARSEPLEPKGEATTSDSAGTHPSDSGATAQPPPQPDPVNPPDLARDQDILDRFKTELRLRGLIGEVRNAATLYLVLTSRLLDKQVSAGVKGHSSSGKSYTVETVVSFFPADAVIAMTAMSERALVYSDRDYQHRTLVLYEVVALREGVEDDMTSYFVRSLLSEGRIDYEVTVRDPNGGFVTKTITKEGPTNLVFTTTKTRVHAENETRVLSLNTDDGRDQTARVLLELANEDTGAGDLTEWRQLQEWLAGACHRVTIPYARTLAERVPPVAVRLRRDFGALLALIRSHAMLHQLSRDRDGQGRIVATVADYAAVRELVAEAIAAGVDATVPEPVRETVTAVAALAGEPGVMASALADKLGLDKSTATRRLRMAADGGYVRNLEDKRGKPGRWIIGDPLPDDTELLPQPRNLHTTGPDEETPGQRGDEPTGCTVAQESGGERGERGRDTPVTPDAVAFLREALADNPQPDAEIRERAAAAGIGRHDLAEARRRLHLSFSGSPWVVSLQQAACIVCDRGTDLVEPEHGLPLHPDCPSPIRTWRWSRKRSDGKRGREDVTVSHRADTWRTGINERGKPPRSGWVSHMETCSSVLDRMHHGRPKCDAPVVWKVTVHIGSKNRTVVYCDADLPDADRPEPEPEGDRAHDDAAAAEPGPPRRGRCADCGQVPRAGLAGTDGMLRCRRCHFREREGASRS